MVNNWLDIIQNNLVAPSCILCDSAGFNGMDLCRDCFDTLPSNANCCYRCAEPFATASPIPRLCGRCLREPPAFHETVAPFLYLRAMRYLISGLKFGRQFKHARLLGQLLAEQIRDNAEPPECIVPIPLHRRRYRERGFNQSIEIARCVSTSLNLPLDLTVCRRLVDTEHQARLPSKRRRKNVRNAFAVSRPPGFKHVALLDDVMTTGATAAELARTLTRAGVERVDIWVCARA